jgi:hypothetical protein
MEIAWELAMRIIPEKPEATGAWTQDAYLPKAQETLIKAQEVIDAVFQAF